jgi:biotin carboxyl carrier protein
LLWIKVKGIAAKGKVIAEFDNRGEIKMVHERDDKYEGQDDGEYHFSDDQMNYEMDAEAMKASAAPSATVTASNMASYKRPLIGLGVFFVLIFFVYKVLAPSSSTTPAPVAEFKANSGQTKPTMSETVKPQPAVAPVAPSQPSPPVVIAPEPSYTPPATTTTNTASAPDASFNTNATSSTVVPAADTARLVALEEQNLKIQADYTQKMSDMVAQNTALQMKVQDLAMRLASMESTLTRLSQNLQELKTNKASVMASAGAMGAQAQTQAPTTLPAPKPAAPKISYSVQAIIPGRAWLKSENGNTVTVAEGDTLKDFGRVVKIDPYDGIVQIDIGNKIIPLSYGASAD